MSADRIDPPVATDSAPTGAESNGASAPDSGTLAREVVMLRARCSNLRHWCRALLADPVSNGLLDQLTTGDLLDTVPEVSESEGQAVVELLARGGAVALGHPLALKIGGADPLRTVLTAEHERLRKAFFALYDHLHPGDDLTDEYFLALQSEGPMYAMSDVLADIEREDGAAPNAPASFRSFSPERSRKNSVP